MTNRPIDRLREEKLHAPEEMDASVVPPRFDEARDHIRVAIGRIERGRHFDRNAPRRLDERDVPALDP